MPSFVTHTMFGDAVKERLRGSWEYQALQDYPAAFQWGTLGPDILFFRNGFKRAPNPLGEYGRLMHKTKTPELFNEIGSYLRSLRDTSEYGPALSYSFGFICHYCTDKNIHPYVYFMQEKMRDSYHSSVPYGIHMKLETDLDSALYNLMTGKKIRYYKIDPLLINSELEIESICKFQAHIVEKVYGGEHSPSFFKPCLTNLYRKEKLMFDPLFFPSYLFCRYLEITQGEKNTHCANCRRHKIAYDILNLEKKEWFNYEKPGKKTRQSIPDLYSEGIEEALKMIAQMSVLSKEDKGPYFKEMPTFDYGNPEPMQIPKD